LVPARDGGGDLGEVALGGFEQILALAGPLARQIGFATNNQALASTPCSTFHTVLGTHAGTLSW
jgi:hypothetical protein